MPEPTPSAAARWAEQLAGWGVPQHIVDQAPESPWGHDVAQFAVDDTIDRDTTSTRWAREVLPRAGGSVLDVGCGGGRSSLPLVPPVAHLTGVDTSGVMLDAYVAAARAAGIECEAVYGAWPDVAMTTPVADVVVCHHVLFNVSDIEPFVMALTAHARLAVVVEVPMRHPMSAWNEAWSHFWQVARPDGPTAVDLLAVLDELGLAPEHAVGPRRPLSRHGAEPAHLVARARRLLCLPPERDAELAAWLGDHPPAWVDDVLTIRWAGDVQDDSA